MPLFVCAPNLGRILTSSFVLVLFCATLTPTLSLSPLSLPSTAPGGVNLDDLMALRGDGLFLLSAAVSSSRSAITRFLETAAGEGEGEAIDLFCTLALSVMACLVVFNLFLLIGHQIRLVTVKRS